MFSYKTVGAVQFCNYFSTTSIWEFTTTVEYLPQIEWVSSKKTKGITEINEHILSPNTPKEVHVKNPKRTR